MSPSPTTRSRADRREPPARREREGDAKVDRIDDAWPPVEYQPESGALAPRDPFEDPDARDPRDDI